MCYHDDDPEPRHYIEGIGRLIGLVVVFVVALAVAVLGG